MISTSLNTVLWLSEDPVFYSLVVDVFYIVLKNAFICLTYFYEIYFKYFFLNLVVKVDWTEKTHYESKMCISRQNIVP